MTRNSHRQIGKIVKQHIDKIQREHMINCGDSYFPKDGNSAALTEPIYSA